MSARKAGVELDKTLTATDEVEAAVEASTNGASPTLPTTFKTSRDVLFNLERVNLLLIHEIIKKFPDPKVPVLMDEEKGRKEENPMDPDYKEAVKENESARSDAVVNGFISLGTKIAHVPDGLPKIDDPAWTEVLEDLGIEVAPENKPRARYIQWVRMWAVNGPADLNGLVRGSMRLSRWLTESDVDESVKSLPSDEGRRTDTEGEATQES